MEHVVRTITAEDVLHAYYSAYGGDYCLCLYLGKVLRHHEADVVLRRLGAVYEHHLARTELAYLLHYLAADAASRAGHEDALATERVCHALQVDLYLVARKKVFDAHLLDLLCLRLRRIPFVCLRDVYMYASRQQVVLQFLVVSERVERSLRHEQTFHVMLTYDVLQIGVERIDAQSHQHTMLHMLLVAHKSGKRHL